MISWENGNLLVLCGEGCWAHRPCDYWYVVGETGLSEYSAHVWQKARWGVSEARLTRLSPGESQTTRSTCFPKRIGTGLSQALRKWTFCRSRSGSHDQTTAPQTSWLFPDMRLKTKDPSVYCSIVQHVITLNKRIASWLLYRASLTGLWLVERASRSAPIGWLLLIAIQCCRNEMIR